MQADYIPAGSGTLVQIEVDDAAACLTNIIISDGAGVSLNATLDGCFNIIVSCGDVVDCAGVCGGSAIEDCAGVCDGSAATDDCGVCDDDSTNDNTTCSQDCAGNWGGDVKGEKKLGRLFRKRSVFTGTESSIGFTLIAFF
mgnify:CR=1 FL=1